MGKVLENGPSEICGRLPLRNFTWPILVYFITYIVWPRNKVIKLGEDPKMMRRRENCA